MENYVEEKGQGYVMRYEVVEKLFSGQSDFQKVEVYETKNFGKMLLNDDLVMITEKDEFVYHEMITHPALFVHPNPKKILVIGGGDGGTAREVLRHKTVEHCDMVEIDAMVVEACRQFIPQTAVGMEESDRFKLHIADGIQWVKDHKDTYDVIIVDSTDPIGPAQPLFNIEFYKDVYASLKEGGIVISQGESPFYNKEMQAKLASILAELFPKVWFMDFHNLTYPGGLWSFSYATKGLDPLKDLNTDAIDASGLKFNYFSANVHDAAFSLPQFQQDNLQKWIKN